MTRPIILVPAFALAIICLIGYGALGCRDQGTPGTGFLVASRADLKPDKLAYEECTLVLAGDKWPVKVSQKQEGDFLQIDLLGHGQVIESERYKSTGEEFSLVTAVGEEFSPPVPLVKYGMRVGETWKWEGKTHTGPAEHAATAKVVTSSESLPIKGQTVANVIRIDVILAFDSGIPDKPAERKLSIWIAPEMGVVRRSYDNYSVREPPVK